MHKVVHRTMTQKMIDSLAVSAEGSIQPPSSKFIPVNETIDILSDTSASTLPRVSLGMKGDVYFIVDNSKNVDRHTAGMKSDIWDNCDAWDPNGTTAKTLFYYQPDSRPLNMFDKKKQNQGYCKAVKVDKKIKCRVCHSQPAPIYIRNMALPHQCRLDH